MGDVGVQRGERAAGVDDERDFSLRKFCIDEYVRFARLAKGKGLHRDRGARRIGALFFHTNCEKCSNIATDKDKEKAIFRWVAACCCAGKEARECFGGASWQPLGLCATFLLQAVGG